MDSSLEQARTLFLEGVAHYEAGRFAQAERQFAGALALVPGRASVLTNLGAVRLKLGRPADALPLLQDALAQDPGNAEALGHCATALAELGRTNEALRLFDRAIAVDPGRPTLWMYRGTALRELGRSMEAAASYREALARGGDEDLLHYYLAAIVGGRAPSRPPRGYVQSLFDGYAEAFDEHLVRTLQYDAPQVLVQRLAGGERHFRHALDLGCGTGLCGTLLRPLADRLTGVDLSARMLEKARGLGVYDDLHEADVADYLAEATGPFDAVMAADVFIYVGALDDVFRRLGACMPAGGVFAFTVEESTDAEVVLRESLRYAHSEAGLRRLAQEHGFAIDAIARRPVREDQRRPIEGLFAWMTKA
jgi:predicted TPR repeat methyltransferase